MLKEKIPLTRRNYLLLAYWDPDYVPVLRQKRKFRQCSGWACRHRSTSTKWKRGSVVRVEVTLELSFEIHNVPSIPNICWMDANVIAMQIVFDRLKHRALHEGLSPDGMKMCARNPEWTPAWNENIEHWL
jgi:hypothetical protein